MPKKNKSVKVPPELDEAFAAFCEGKSLKQEGLICALLVFGMHTNSEEREWLLGEYERWKADAAAYQRTPSPPDLILATQSQLIRRLLPLLNGPATADTREGQPRLPPPTGGKTPGAGRNKK